MTMPPPASSGHTMFRRVLTLAVAVGALVVLNQLVALLPLSFLLQPLAVGFAGYYAVDTVKDQW